MPKAKNVTVIPATLNIHTKTPTKERVRRRVAAYARVSTDSEEQLTSYEAQVDYYTRFIQENPDWDFVEVYTDEGISAVNTKRRDGFNRMIRDALAGKIDLIVTKSVSRFARNTVDSLTTIRKLKEAGCECFFQKENIMTFDSKGELLITIMSSLAQEESRSISENVTWGQRKRFSDGKVSIPYGQFLGYRKGADGLPEIVPEEAEIVKRIYREFLQGKSTNAIATMLTEECIPTPGKKTIWQRATVESILRNEKYKGSALLQKSFTVDFLTKKTKINEGEVPQYYVEDSHPAIIEPWEWEQVQVELERRKNSRNRHHQTSPFSGKIICADCSDIFGAKTWNSTNKYKRTVWQCNDKFKDKGHRCTTPHLNEDDIKARFIAAYNSLIPARENILDVAIPQDHPAREEVRTVVEELDVTQGKLGMGFSCGSSDTAALLMGNTLFGGSSNSKLFLNVREKLSLCYYASSLYHRQKGLITVSSGIEFDNYQKAYDEILAQLAAVQNGDLEDWELEGARSTLLNAYASMGDSQGKLENFYLGQAVTGQSETPEDLAAQVRQVTPERIFKAMKTVKLDTVYFLRGKEAAE